MRPPISERPRDGFTVAEYAELSSLSASTVRRRIADGTLPKWQPAGPGTRVIIPVACLPSAVTSALSPLPALPVPVSAEAVKPRISGPTPRWKRDLNP